MNDIGFLKVINLVFKRDLNIAKSYSVRFLYSIVFVFIQILIFYFMTSFIQSTSNNNVDQQELFLYFIVGIAFLDYSQLLISYPSSQLEQFKVSGVFQEILCLPISNITYFLASNVYPACFAFYRLTIYLIFLFIFSSQINLNIADTIFLIINFLIFSLSVIGFSLLSIAITIAFHKSSFFLAIYAGFAVIFGGIFYSAEVLPDVLQVLSYLLPISTYLEIFRGIFVDEIAISELILKSTFLMLQTFIYFFIGLFSLKNALRYIKRNDKQADF